MSGQYKPFSERYGCTQPKLPQREGMGRNLRVGLWNAFYTNFRSATDTGIHDFDEPVIFYSNPIHQKIFARFLKNSIDEYEDNPFENERYIKAFFLDEEWKKVLDLVDFIIQTDYKKAFADECNTALAQENSAYRIVDKFVMEIASEQEITEIETALKIPFDEARSHLEKALALFSDRENPDFENSIKESISAVESIAKEVSGDSKATLGQLADGLNLHSAFRGGLKKLYGFTSDAGGIRHAGDSSKSGKYLKPDQATARFMLVTCSAFVTYIIANSKTVEEARYAESTGFRIRVPTGRATLRRPQTRPEKRAGQPPNEAKGGGCGLKLRHAENAPADRGKIHDSTSAD